MYSREFESYRQINPAMGGWHAMRAALHNISARAGARWFTSVVGTVRVTPFGQGVAQTVRHFRQTMNDASRETQDAQSPAARKGSDTAAVSNSSKGTPWPL